MQRRCVVHYQLPASVDIYVHRSGRTARAEEEGIAIALVTPKVGGGARPAGRPRAGCSAHLLLWVPPWPQICSRRAAAAPAPVPSPAAAHHACRRPPPHTHHACASLLQESPRFQALLKAMKREEPPQFPLVRRGGPLARGTASLPSSPLCPLARLPGDLPARPPVSGMRRSQRLCPPPPLLLHNFPMLSSRDPDRTRRCCRRCTSACGWRCGWTSWSGSRRRAAPKSRGCSSMRSSWASSCRTKSRVGVFGEAPKRGGRWGDNGGCSSTWGSDCRAAAAAAALLLPLLPCCRCCR